MPLYEYQCENCGDLFEVMQKFSDPPLTNHEKCGGRVHRVLSAPALQFKGSGWYVTDYARGSKAEKDGGDKKAGDKTAPEAKPSGATDTPAPASSSSEKKSTSSEAKSD
ncbi:MAG: zinc ribbon domain-containing protein [Acidobacteriaceae bacterium]|nr:zinc ribbon domain-containing protein [Acidobacteriaceae bacterium]MBV9778952.1 zinc ribbon domain-containing protein [Acidobacteriaceae bacterium]